METIVLDANVLFSNTLRGLFLWLAWSDLCQINWTEELWDEVFRNYSDDINVEQRFRSNVRQVIFSRFPTSMKVLAKGFTSVGLPDPGDEHVVALALQEGIYTVVTFNLKDFPQTVLSKRNLRACPPDTFLCDLLVRFPDGVKGAVAEHINAQKETKPKKIAYFESLKRANANGFATKLEAEDAAGNLFPEVWP